MSHVRLDRVSGITLLQGHMLEVLSMEECLMGFGDAQHEGMSHGIFKHAYFRAVCTGSPQPRCVSFTETLTSSTV